MVGSSIAYSCLSAVFFLLNMFYNRLTNIFNAKQRKALRKYIDNYVNDRTHGITDSIYRDLAFSIKENWLGFSVYLALFYNSVVIPSLSPSIVEHLIVYSIVCTGIANDYSTQNAKNINKKISKDYFGFIFKKYAIPATLLATVVELHLNLAGISYISFVLNII